MKSYALAAKCAAIAICYVLLCAMAFVSCGPALDPEKSTGSSASIIEYAAESDVLILSYGTSGGMIAPADTTPLLRIYGDGRALVHFPDSSARTGDYVLQLSSKEMAALLESLSRKGVMTFEPDAIKREIGNAVRARSGPRAGAVVSDDVTTHIEVQLERYRPADSSRAPIITDFRRTLSWYALGADARQYPEVEALQAMAAAERELLDLAMRDDLRPTEP